MNALPGIFGPVFNPNLYAGARYLVKPIAHLSVPARRFRVLLAKAPLEMASK
jgi:hypothetical protein